MGPINDHGIIPHIAVGERLKQIILGQININYPVTTNFNPF